MNLSTYLKSCTSVYHTTFDPREAGVCRVHLIPPKKPHPWTPWVAIINGYSLIPLSSGWAVLLKIFMEHLNAYANKVLSPEDIKTLLKATTDEARTIFPHVPAGDFLQDLDEIIATLKDIAMGKEPSAKIGYMSLAKYAKHMKAPHRMDVMLSAMKKEGKWACNQHCAYCYAAQEKMAEVPEMSTEEWETVIDKLQEIGIPSITFTGGEATLRDDLPRLILHASWFVTRLNTNGIRLTPELCHALVEASLDSVQITLYSSESAIHNLLVGGPHFEETVTGIKNALAAGLDVSINTPLSSINKDYLSTIRFLEGLGVRYFSCSGLIPSGGALSANAKNEALTKKEITAIVKEAHDYAREKGMEVSFTSPGWIAAKTLKEMQMVVPSCGACLSNMAIAPNGDVIPCQSWLGGFTLGNIRLDPWKKIWNSQACKAIRHRAEKEGQVCLLKED